MRIRFFQRLDEFEGGAAPAFRDIAIYGLVDVLARKRALNDRPCLHRLARRRTRLRSVAK